MIQQLETYYLEQQLHTAEQERQSRQWENALMYYQRAYHEACWLCTHFINGECEKYALQALNYLQCAAAGCIDCSDSPSTHLSIELDLIAYQAKIRSTFRVKLSRSLLPQPSLISQALSIQCGIFKKPHSNY